MVKLQCEICGGNLVMDESGEFAVCDSCGMHFKKETVKKMLVELSAPVKIDGTVQVEGLVTLEKLLQNGEKFLELKEFDKAVEVFKKIMNEYPEDYRGWWGYVRASTNNMMITSYYIKNNSLPERAAINAVKLADDNKKEELQNTYNGWLKKCQILMEEQDNRSTLNSRIEYQSKKIKEINQGLQETENTVNEKTQNLNKIRMKFITCVIIGALALFWLIASISEPDGWLIIKIPIILAIIIFTWGGAFFDDVREMSWYKRDIEKATNDKIKYEKELLISQKELKKLKQSLSQINNK